MRQETMGFWNAVASAGPQANNLTSLQTHMHQHLITQFLETGFSSWRPTNSVKALKDSKTLVKLRQNR